ncbi:MAG: RDD family protein [Gammaproteobacteria bacterium]
MSEATSIEANPYQTPTAQIDDIVEDISGEMATRGSRLGAYFLDMFMFLIPMLVVMGLLGGFAEGDQETIKTANIAGMVAAAVFFFSINGVLLHRYGQTIGKRMLKIRITRTDGSHAGLSRLIILRYTVITLISLIPAIGVIISLVDPLMIFQKSNRCLHDLIADTIVVKA